MTCKLKNKWPGIVSTVFGPCDVCGEIGRIFETTTKSLLPSHKKVTGQNIVMKEVDEIDDL